MRTEGLPPENALMPLESTHFIYQMHDQASFAAMERSFDMRAVRHKPRKGIYDNVEGGYKAFNNPVQTSAGNNAVKQDEDDPDATLRMVFVTVTAVRNNTSLDLKFRAKPWTPTPVISQLKAGAARLSGLFMVASLVCSFVSLD